MGEKKTLKDISYITLFISSQNERFFREASLVVEFISRGEGRKIDLSRRRPVLYLVHL